MRDETFWFDLALQLYGEKELVTHHRPENAAKAKANPAPSFVLSLPSLADACGGSRIEKMKETTKEINENRKNFMLVLRVSPLLWIAHWP